MKTYEEIKAIMDNATGTANYHRVNPFYRFVLATDGVLTVLEQAKCFWLFDVVGSYYPQMKAIEDSFFVATLEVKKSSAKFKITHEDLQGNDIIVAKQAIDFTDLPDGDYKFFICTQDEYYVVMCPSEY